jgi:hypothetical protein
LRLGKIWVRNQFPVSRSSQPAPKAPQLFQRLRAHLGEGVGVILGHSLAVVAEDECRTELPAGKRATFLCLADFAFED